MLGKKTRRCLLTPSARTILSMNIARSDTVPTHLCSTNGVTLSNTDWYCRLTDAYWFKSGCSGVDPSESDEDIIFGD